MKQSKRDAIIDQLVNEVEDWDLETLIEYSKEGIKSNLKNLPDKLLVDTYKEAGSEKIKISKEELNKIEHDIKCDKCGKSATINVQNLGQSYDLQPSGVYIKDEEWVGDDNHHYCDDCAKTEL